MEKVRLLKKRMVYPEMLNLDQVSPKPKAYLSWFGEQRSNTTSPSKNSSGSSSNVRSQFIQERIRHLVDAFSHRAHATRERIQMPQTPSSIASRDNLAPPPLKTRLPTERRSSLTPLNMESSLNDLDEELDYYVKQPTRYKVIDPQGKIYVFWMLTAAMAVLWNVWMIPLRSTFSYQNASNRYIWMAFDYLADFIYILDMFLMQPRLMFLSEGFWMKDYNFTKQNYLRKYAFKLDMISLVPLDLLYVYFGPEMVILRFPRLIKLHTFWEFFSVVDKLIASPHIIRIARTLLYMMYLIHLNACAYYAFSVWEGIGANNFVYNGKGNAYIKCFYFATKTATSIGKNPKPTQEVEFMFMTVSWLMGVFVFALLIGQIRDIIATATRLQTDYKKLVDETLEYMRRLNMPQEMQRRVQLWFNYTWETQHTLDENTIMDCLPHKMKTDIAINVHINILNKVKLFADCDEALLRELVLQLRSVIYLPGDIICKRGDVGKEMYIVQSGHVQVLGKDGKQVLATLTEGSVFGEISLLGIKGMNRRTADVRSNGYSNLFVLSKADLNAALSHYPEAQTLLNKKAKSLMRKNAAMENQQQEALIVINNPQSKAPDAKLLNTVMQVLPKDSSTNKLLRYGSRKSSATIERAMQMSETGRSLPSLSISDDEGDRNFQTTVTVHRSMN